ncbi:MAG: heliorhodopsin HeR [bacterium]|nr:heliorhodopsin HeR [bacterium]
MTKKITMDKLRKLNILMALLHGLQAITILILSKGFSLPISGDYLRFNDATQSLEPATAELFKLSLPLLIFIFFALSSAAHLFIATRYRKTYESNLTKGINKVRWIEYSLSASIMIVAVSLLVGIYDLTSLVMLFALTAIMNLCGLLMEVHNQTTKTTNWISYWIGCLAGAIPWIVIAFYLWLGAANGSSAPTFVYGIFVSIFIFFNCFAINMALQYKKVGKWNNYLYGERAYIFLSLIAKSLLAWQVFAGTLRP